MYLIYKTFRFSAAHRLAHLEESHPCFRLHGHNYVVRVAIAAPTLDARGFVIDYRDLGSGIGTWLHDSFDHQFLNNVVPDGGLGTTAEILARTIYRKALQFIPATPNGPHVAWVEVCETENTCARFTP